MIKPMHLPSEIKGKDIVAKAVSAEMSMALFAAIDDSREHLREFLYWVDNVKTVDDESKAINELILNMNDASIFMYVIFNNNGKLIGTIDVHEISYASNSAKIGYWLRKDETGKGFISKALQMLESALWAAGLHRLVIECVVENKASAAVAERSGYLFEGIATDKIYGYEKYWNCKVYAKINPA